MDALLEVQRNLLARERQLQGVVSVGELDVCCAVDSAEMLCADMPCPCHCGLQLPVKTV